MENRPTIKLQVTNSQRWINRLSLIIMALTAIYLVFIYQKLPNEIPMHFNFRGDVDNWGPKWTIFILWGIGLIIYLLNTSTQSIPQKYNYIVKITAENAEKQYKLAIQMMSFLKLELMVLIAYLLWAVVQNALDKMNYLNIYVMGGFVICLFSTLIIYISKSRKYR